MKTNPIGPGTANITVNVPAGMKADLEELAKASGLKLGAYIRAVIRQAAKSGALVSEVVTPTAQKKSTRERQP